MSSPGRSPNSPEPNTPRPRPDLLAGALLPPPPRQARSRQKREALLEAALMLFAERGFEAASVEDIARTAGVAVGGFYLHFRSKHQLLLVLMDRLLASLEAFDLTIDPAGDVRAQLAGLLHGGLHLDWGYRGAFRAWREVMLSNPEWRELDRQIEAWTAEWLGRALTEMGSFPGARPGIDHTMTAHLLSLLFWQLVLTLDDDGIEATVGALTALLYHTLFVDS